MLNGMWCGGVSVGTDIVEVARVSKLVARFGDSFLWKIFTDEEIAYCSKLANSAIGFSARFAAKEAFSKALGAGIGGKIGWKDVAVRKKSSGEPLLLLSGKAEAIVKELGFSLAKISISHTKTLAHSVVVLI
jgi:holo-[acyl-carrier protein] synthase